MVLEDHLRLDEGVQLEWRGVRYGVEGNIEQGALNRAAAQAVLGQLAEKGFPVDEVEIVEDEGLLSEAHPESDYVVVAMLSDFEDDL